MIIINIIDNFCNYLSNYYITTELGMLLITEYCIKDLIAVNIKAV